MWIASKYGWFSIVKKADGFHIRARRRGDLVNLSKLFDPQGMRPSRPEIVRSYPGSDYPWRMITPQYWVVEQMVSLMVDQIDYPNFKEVIHTTPDQAHKGAGYGQMWAIAKRWEDGQ
jgi:hypothetical protein